MPKFQTGDKISLKADPFIVETVTRITQDGLGNYWYYTVLLDGRKRTTPLAEHEMLLAGYKNEMAF